MTASETTSVETGESVCRCGLSMPVTTRATDPGYGATPECWLVYTEVLGEEFGNALLFGAVHQVTVDTYAVQHPTAVHRDKSIAVHLTGLHLVLDRGMRSPYVAAELRRLAAGVEGAGEPWPHFASPDDLGPLTVFDVAMASSGAEHIDTVMAWATGVWRAWASHHDAVIALATRHLSIRQPSPSGSEASPSIDSTA